MNRKTISWLAVFYVIYLAILAGFLPGCSSMEIPKFRAHITLPASGDGYWVTTTTAEEGRIPKEEWAKKSRRGIILLSEDWKILRYSLLKNCLTMTCKNAVGTFDGLFEAIDKAVKPK